ncbi:hypothetical protein [Lignipirellula cremea]|uniref:Uncharacterized protein n=1 Tax=Lignipirellula cremea TaxID=2528010 RepID=A0A518E0L3_9BACT|nr:hypothetical protein [Lignipirellula cremea]QDU97630.1 hypothetical protein Pla8534_54800 [Lignipirellula cremea]
MQLSAIFRRGVVLPLTPAAQLRMEKGQLEGELAVRWLDLSHDLFSVIWGRGFFQEINARLGSQIDDYVEEVVPWESLPVILELTQQQARLTLGGAPAGQFFHCLADLCREGFSRKMPLYFVL